MITSGTVPRVRVGFLHEDVPTHKMFMYQPLETSLGVQYSKIVGYSYKRNINAMINDINIGHMRMDTNTPNICALFNDAEDWGFLGRK